MGIVRLFKVYAREPGCSAQTATEPELNPRQELCFAHSPQMAAEIIQTIWHEYGFSCERFQVVELILPDCVHEGRFVGVVSEPNSNGEMIHLPVAE